MEFLSRDNIDLLFEVCEDMNISRDTLTNYAKIFYDNYPGGITNDIMEMNKSFLLHMSAQSSTVGIYDKKDSPPTVQMEYKNEFALKLPPQPSFLDTTESPNEELNVLIEQKMKERENELLNIQRSYNPDDIVESVRLIKISDVLAELNVFDEDPIVSDKPKVTIGDTVYYNYKEDEAPNQIKQIDLRDEKVERIKTMFQSLIHHMDIIDKKMDILTTTIQSYINI
jgi:hypothetical protein